MDTNLCVYIFIYIYVHTSRYLCIYLNINVGVTSSEFFLMAALAWLAGDVGRGSRASLSSGLAAARAPGDFGEVVPLSSLGVQDVEK